MATKLQGEKWKEVKFDFRFTNDYRLEISDSGRLRTFNKFSAGEILKGSTINGYRIIRLKLYKPKNKKMREQLDAQHERITTLQAKVTGWKQDLVARRKNDPAFSRIKKQLADGDVSLVSMKAELKRMRQDDIKDRTIHYHSLVHRLVAEYFCRSKSLRHTVVGHLDYQKLNNRADNLRWMTPEENYRHQQLSPFVISEKKDRVTLYKDHPRGAKLSVEKVSDLKKMLNEGKKIKALVKKFKITDTQILRIKRGENWGSVKAAK